METVFLALANSYDSVEVALFSNETLVSVLTEHKAHASKLLIPMISSLLKDNHLETRDLAAIAVNQGPGPFTTLRVIISTANGLSFATGLPLIGVDGLKTLVDAQTQETTSTTIALLDAFNNDVYFGIKTNNQFDSGYANASSVFEKLEPYAGTHVLVVGNALKQHHDKIRTLLGSRAVLEPDTMVTIEQIGAAAYELYLSGKSGNNQLFPLYLKQQLYKNQQGILTGI